MGRKSWWTPARLAYYRRITPRPSLDDVAVTLRTLIVWMAGSANSPISRTEAERLLEMLKEADRG